MENRTGDDDPTPDDFKRGWRALSGQGLVGDQYQCLRPDDNNMACAATFATRRALGSHQGRGHTAKAKRTEKDAESDELAAAIGRAFLACELDAALERRVVERIRELAHESVLRIEDEGALEIHGLATFLLTQLGGEK